MGVSTIRNEMQQEGVEIVKQSRVFVEYMLKCFDYVSSRTTTLILNMFAVLAIIDFESHKFVLFLFFVFEK
jgi:hypothetical protein